MFNIQYSTVNVQLNFIYNKIPHKKGPCRNRGRLPKLTAYEKIFIVFIFVIQISKELLSTAVKKIQNAVKGALKRIIDAAYHYMIMTKKILPVFSRKDLTV